MHGDAKRGAIGEWSSEFGVVGVEWDKFLEVRKLFTPVVVLALYEKSSAREEGGQDESSAEESKKRESDRYYGGENKKYPDGSLK